MNARQRDFATRIILLFLLLFLAVSAVSLCTAPDSTDPGSSVPPHAPTSTSDNDKPKSAPDPVLTLIQSPVSELRPSGELARMLTFGSKHTDVQRENKLSQIKGKVVEWNLPVYEVKRIEGGYRIQTSGTELAILMSDESLVATTVDISPRSQSDRDEIESLMTGDLISFKGLIDDITLRTLEIRPAIYTATALLSVQALLHSRVIRQSNEAIVSREIDGYSEIAMMLDAKSGSGLLTEYNTSKSTKPDFLKNLYENGIRSKQFGIAAEAGRIPIAVKGGRREIQDSKVMFFRESLGEAIKFGVIVRVDDPDAARHLWCGLKNSGQRPFTIRIDVPGIFASFTAAGTLRAPAEQFSC